MPESVKLANYLYNSHLRRFSTCIFNIKYLRIWGKSRTFAIQIRGNKTAYNVQPVPNIVQLKHLPVSLVCGEMGNSMTNNKSNVSAYVAECKENATIVASLEVLNDYRKSLLSECTANEVVAARKELDAARTKYNKLATAYVLGEESYCNLQTECVRAAVSEFSHTHNLPRFFQWFNDNGKDEQTTIIDSVQRLGSKLASLHTSFASGSKVARKQKASEEDLTERIAKLQAELAALRGEK